MCKFYGPLQWLVSRIDWWVITVQCLVSSVQCPVSSVQCKYFNIECPVNSLQCRVAKILDHRSTAPIKFTNPPPPSTLYSRHWHQKVPPPQSHRNLVFWQVCVQLPLVIVQSKISNFQYFMSSVQCSVVYIVSFHWSVSSVFYSVSTPQCAMLSVQCPPSRGSHLSQDSRGLKLILSPCSSSSKTKRLLLLVILFSAFLLDSLHLLPWDLWCPSVCVFVCLCVCATPTHKPVKCSAFPWIPHMLTNNNNIWKE